MQRSIKQPTGRIASLLIAAVIAACGGNDNHSSTSNNEKLQRAQSSAALEQYLKNGLKSAVASNGTIENYPVTDAASPEAPPQSDAGASDQPGVSLGHSTTILIEEGVDEPDLVKFDGTVLFVGQPAPYILYAQDELSDPLAGAPEPTSDSGDNSVRIMTVSDANHSATELAKISIPHASNYDRTRLDGLLLVNNDDTNMLVSISEGTQFSSQPFSSQPDGDMNWCSIWSWTQGGTIIDIFDVTQPTQAAHQHRIDIEGYLLMSRRIDNTLYVITRYTPSLDLNGSQDDQIAQIDNTSIDQLLPTVAIDGSTKSLVSAQDCYVDSSTTGYPTLMVVSAINLNDNSIESSCVTANLYQAYMAKNSVYLTQYEWAEDNTELTHIYKFSLKDDAPSYVGEGRVSGVIPPNDAFSMSEYNDVLRVVTYNWSSMSEVENQLYSLGENNEGNLEILATLPNSAHPETIGKPGERIMGVRFVGDKAYVVTFLQIDPLYVIDLSNPEDPFIAGQVELPGFSTLLQPLQNGLILGIGSEGNFLKAELYDVQNPAAPISLNKFVLYPVDADYSTSPAQWDHHALALQQLPDQTIRAAVPFYSNSYNDNGFRQEKGALTFVVDTQQRQMSSVTTRSVTNEDYVSYIQRVVLHDNTLHYIESSDVWSGDWNSTDLLTNLQ